MSLGFFWQPGVKLEDIERHTIISALKFFQGNRTHTADSLGVNIRTIIRKCHEYKEKGFFVPEPRFPELPDGKELKAK